jgi:hypothetical protein
MFQTLFSQPAVRRYWKRRTIRHKLKRNYNAYATWNEKSVDNYDWVVMGRKVVVVYVQHLYEAAASQRVSTQEIHLQTSLPNVNVKVMTTLPVQTFIFCIAMLRSLSCRRMQPPTPKVEAESSSETLISIYKTIWCHNLQKTRNWRFSDVHVRHLSTLSFLICCY